MSTSETPSERHPDRAPVEESDFAQRPEEESSRARASKIVWVIVLIAIGVVAIPVIFILFSALVQEIGGEDVEEEPAEETAPEEP